MNRTNRFIALVCVIILTVSISAQKVLSNKSNLETVKYCSLLVEPNNFLDKVLIVEAIYVAGFETSWLENSSKCEKVNGIGLEFDQFWKNNSDPSVLDKMSELLKVKNNRIGEQRKIQTVLRGKLIRKPITVNEKIAYVFQFVVQRVESVKKY